MGAMCVICQRRQSKWPLGDPTRCGYCMLSQDASVTSSTSEQLPHRPQGCQTEYLNGRWELSASEYQGHGLRHLAGAVCGITLLVPMGLVLTWIGTTFIDAARGIASIDVVSLFLYALLFVPCCVLAFVGYLILHYLLWLSKRRVHVSIESDRIRVFEGLQMNRPAGEGLRNALTLCEVDWKATHSGGDWTCLLTTEPPLRFAERLPRERLVWLCGAISDALDGRLPQEETPRS